MRGTKLRLAIVASAGIVAATAAQGGAASTLRDFTPAVPAMPFHSHPLIPAAPPTGSLNTPLTEFLQSYNWSGYALNSGGPFDSVSGCWTVPAVTGTSGQLTFSSAWVGIDGVNNLWLIQTGTEQDWDAGVAEYFAWWEIITPTSMPAATLIGGVSPGDQICASVAIGSPNSTISISDQTSGGQFTTQQPYAGPDSSAEWIMEAPYATGSFGSCGPCPLAYYGQTNLDPVSVNGHNPDLTTASGIGWRTGGAVKVERRSLAR